MTLAAEPRHRSTQKERVKDLLRSAGANGLCSISLYALGLPNGRNRIVELRDDDGLDIETFSCDLALHEPETPAHVRYRWIWQKAARQLALAIT
jgi:hypothetical protein